MSISSTYFRNSSIVTDSGKMKIPLLKLLNFSLAWFSAEIFLALRIHNSGLLGKTYTKNTNLNTRMKHFIPSKSIKVRPNECYNVAYYILQSRMRLNCIRLSTAFHLFIYLFSIYLTLTN